MRKENKQQHRAYGGPSREGGLKAALSNDISQRRPQRASKDPHFGDGRRCIRGGETEGSRSGGRGGWRFREMERERRTTKRVNRGGGGSRTNSTLSSTALLKNEEEMKFRASWRERETTRRTDGMEWSITQSGGEGPM